MLNSEDHSGVVVFLFGLVMVVLVGVGLSMFADQRFIDSSGALKFKKQVKESESVLVGLRVRVRKKADELAVVAPKRTYLSDCCRDEGKTLEALVDRKVELDAVKAQELETIARLKAEFEKFRGEYRRSEWARAKGESIGELRIPGGRVFKKVVIVKVTPVGLEVRHEHGIARLQAPELSREMRDRFQWDDAKRLAHLEIERSNRESLTASPEDPVKRRKKSRSKRPSDRELGTLRSGVIRWKSKVAVLKSAEDWAASRVEDRSQSSVPGALETWEDRASRLGRELAKANAELAQAKALLREVSPRDRLLRKKRSSQ